MKIRSGFVSNSSSSSYLCLGVEDPGIIQKLIKASGLEKNEEGFYDEEGYGRLEGGNITFYGNSGFGEDDAYWQAAGLNENQTKEVLETKNLKQAKKWFVGYIKEKFNIKIDPKVVDLYFGEASSE